MADAKRTVAKTDEVSRNQIWREHLKKELLTEGPSTAFQFNPKTLSSVAPKPTSMQPSDFTATHATNAAPPNEIETKVRQGIKNPQERSDVPSTEAQKIGWAHDQAWKNGRAETNKRWYRGRGSTDVTVFAENYCAMAGCSPFADKSTR
ncbi:hypothetical protein SPRG_06786 [Saprolegnia parasitica CBS 223.65]|uniref:Uncharacterized protein n=1 Tax=Saprolegnia parasitica (strain CBS 223.65) TaxID=695850 RepID=A0A067C9R8_SAPPC|nr:hypothetical protein SPRG_06786 [Saprolegnia parasitica CBS 223.65]KDO27519.1 hypothetical protein SPRG_06786 [Saprolegnia parasitica CBS 223.65]|eukprot:XP_012201646.1 hypothetical protein SPRG_06786 [Saprolegnia parasitica CBS 223.65]